MRCGRRRAQKEGSAASRPVRTATALEVFLTKFYSVLNYSVILIAAGALHAQTASVDKSSLSFSAITNGAVQTQVLTVNNAGSASFAIFSNAPWLKVNGL